MARYISLFTTSNPAPNLRQTLTETLKSCALNLVYETSDYLMAQEKAGTGVLPAACDCRSLDIAASNWRSKS